MKVTITIPPRALRHLQERVACGELASIEEGVLEALEGYADDEDELEAYLKPRLEALDRGEGIPGEEVHARLRAKRRARAEAAE